MILKALAVETGVEPKYHDVTRAVSDRITELEGALRSVVDMHRDRYACASEWNDCFERARKILEQTT